MVKYTGKVPQYSKIIMFLVKRLKVVAKCCLFWNFFYTVSSVVVFPGGAPNVKTRNHVSAYF